MIFLQILKIIGIVLACIVGFVILIVLLALLFPLTYRIKADGKNADIRAQFTANLIFGLVHFKLAYADKRAEYKARIAGIPVFKGSFGKDEANAVKEAIDEEAEPSGAAAKPIEAAAKPSKAAAKHSDSAAKSSGEDADSKAKHKKHKKEKSVPDEDRQDELHASAEKPGKLKKIKNAVKKFIDKIRAIIEKIKKVKYILDAPVTKRAIRYTKECLLDILNHIKPRRIKGRVDFGLDDPATTAELYGVLGCLACAIDDKLIIAPDFDEKGIELDVEIKGRIILIYVIIKALSIWLNKDFKKVMNYIRRNF